MRERIIQVDAFTDKPFLGNPAAVCVLQEEQPDAQMQMIALEMNLSETAFLWPMNDGFSLRWFTPTVEVDLCGHATLASAHVLWEDQHIAWDDEARFYTRSGLLTARRQDSWIRLNFPIIPASAIDMPRGLAEILGVRDVQFVGVTEGEICIIVLPDEQAVRNVRPDYGRLAEQAVRAVIVTSRSASDDYDFVSRYFAPVIGINEDPVTGSAHCCLGPYWSSQLKKDSLVGYQASARGGVVQVQMDGERALISGQAITVLRSELVV